MRCQRCGAEDAIGLSLQEEQIGPECLRDLERPEVKQRITDHAEDAALSRYLKRYGVRRWRLGYS